jgi:hypothetical protein
MNFVFVILATFADYDEYERSMLISQMSFEKSFGQSSVFIESTLMENGGLPESADPSTLIKEAIHVISCGYEEKTEWGKEVYFLLFSVYSYAKVLGDTLFFFFCSLGLTACFCFCASLVGSMGQLQRIF